MDGQSFLFTMVVFLLLFNVVIRVQAKSRLLAASRVARPTREVRPRRGQVAHTAGLPVPCSLPQGH